MVHFVDPVETKDSFGNVIILTEAGQMGAYKDHRWSGSVRIDRPQLNTEDTVRSIIEHNIQCGHIYSVGVQRMFASPYFTRFEQSADDPHVWHFTVMRDYLD